GPTFDYTHRLLDPALAETAPPVTVATAASAEREAAPHVTKLLDGQGLIETHPPANPDTPVGDLTREPLEFPAGRDLRLQALARGDEGFLLALG
ncbi:carbon-phosphorus lyase complex subunit PhnI, partial [Acinetobacter baumannii]